MSTLVAFGLAAVAGAIMGRAWISVMRARRARSLARGEELPPRPSILGNADQRRRALWVAVVLAAVATAAAASGVDGLATPVLMVAILLTIQAGLFEVIARMRRGPTAN